MGQGNFSAGEKFEAQVPPLRIKALEMVARLY